jgi:hypothetical protein
MDKDYIKDMFLDRLDGKQGKELEEEKDLLAGHIEKLCRDCLTRPSMWENELNEIQSVMSDCGFTVTRSQIWKVIQQDREAWISEMLWEAFSDTMPREAMWNGICENETGMSAPTYGDGEEYAQKVWALAKKKGLIK